jgi:hypothetical protein
MNPTGFLGRLVSTDWDWPAIVDLDGKEKTAIVVPFVDYAGHASGLELLDGNTGESRWKRPLARIEENWQPPQTYRVVAGPDLDGDGRRELFAASYDPNSGRVYVDALSGASGRILWSNQQIVAFPNQPGGFRRDKQRRDDTRRRNGPDRAPIDQLRPARGVRRQRRRPIGSRRL